MRKVSGKMLCGLLVLGTLYLPCAPALAAEPADSTSPAASDIDELDEVIVTAPEPRYVARTNRDRIGRIWAPVYINDKGPFRLVLDTGASTSAISPAIAKVLELPMHRSQSITLRGVTGSAEVPTIKVDSLVVGDLVMRSKRLPIIFDAFGGAEGVLGTEGMSDKRIHIDFGSDFIIIKRSRSEPAAPDFQTIPIEFMRGKVLTTDALIGGIRIKAIIDTGLQITVANVAARDALLRQAARGALTTDEIVGATADIQVGERYLVPSIRIGDIVIRKSQVTFGDMHIFKHWKLLDEPAILIGMDVIGTLDVLIIDYKRAELQVRVRSGK